VAFRSSRTRTTVPSRIKRIIGSSASERAFQTSQSPFTFRRRVDRVKGRDEDASRPDLRRPSLPR
jgi:hypothetical protein